MSMTKTQINSRVGAMLYADDKQVCLLGYGVYEGDHVPPAEVNTLFAELNIPNPRITLDDGRVVWGCQCWWGPEHVIQAKIGTREVVNHTEAL